MTMRTLTFLAALGALVALSLGVAGAQSPSTPAGLPDLNALPPTDARIEAVQIDGQTRLLLRFNGYIHNKLGAGLLDLRGAVPTGVGGEMRQVVQRVYAADGTFSEIPSAARFAYETSDGHRHWHLFAAAAYSLWTADGAAEVKEASKVGFCMGDSVDKPEYTDANAPPAVYDPSTDNCADGRPDAQTVKMGLTPGHRDVYWYGLWFQWVDISNVQPGLYRIRAQVDPDNFVRELNEADAPADLVDVPVPGYVAQPVTVSDIPRTGATMIDLAATAVPAPDRTLQAPRFELTEAPRHGTVVWADDAHTKLSYTPDPGTYDSDVFKVAVRESGSAFPLAPAQATVTVTRRGVPAEVVAVSGAPATLETDTSVQLRATVTGGPGGAPTWSVNGIAGGNATVGTVNANGLYQAPLRVPATPTVRIRATGPGGAYGEAPTRIVAPAPPKPAPTNPTDGTRKGAIRSAKVRHSGPFAVATILTRRRGTLVVVIRGGSKRLGRCKARVLAGRAFACRIRVKPKDRKRRLTAVATLASAGRVTRAEAAHRRYW